METQGHAPVLVIGAGPAGLAVSRCLKDLHIPYDLVDRHGEAGGAYLRMYSRMQLSSPPTYLGLPGSEPPEFDRYLHASEYAEYVRLYARDNGITPIRRGVRNIELQGLRFAVTFSEDAAPAEYMFVVVCTGSFDNPNVPIVLGLNDHAGSNSERIPFIHACEWKGPQPYRTARLLIVGGGMTAIELAEECVRSGITPILSFRRGRGRTFPQHILGLDPRFIVYPLMSRTPITMFRRQCLEGWAYRGIDRGFELFRRRQLVDIRPRIQAVRGRIVTFTDGSFAEVDRIVFATGYRWDMPFLPDSIEKGAQGNLLLEAGQSPVWPGLFCVGITCAFSASSHFIHGISSDARRVAKAISKRIIDMR